MRLTTVRTSASTSAARVDDDRLVLLPAPDVGALLREPGWRELAAGWSGRSVPLAGAAHATLVPAPEKVICVGANFQSHIEEVGLPNAEYPSLFAKFSRSLIGAGDAIALPTASACVDWEVELGVVIGTPVRDARPEDALEAVAGYTVVNDISMRDWQLRTGQFLQGKTWESSTPVGPFLVTPEEVDHARDLEMTCVVDGVEMQRASTAEMIFSVAEVIAYISTIITLVPGDLIAMGTPAGIGAIRTPPDYLHDGAVVRTSIEGLGTQVNRCAAAGAPAWS